MKPMVVTNAAEGIAREESLLQCGQPARILWTSTENALVVPRAWLRRETFGTCSQEAEQKGWPLLLRSSGGGAVPQGPGTLNLAIIAPIKPDLDHTACYREICSVIASALNQFGISSDVGAVGGAFCDGDWNVTVAGKKLVGTAQRWRRHEGRNVALVHAAILMERLPNDFWPILAKVEGAVGTSLVPQSDVHVTVEDLLPGKNRIQRFYKALDQAAKNSLTGISMANLQTA